MKNYIFLILLFFIIIPTYLTSEYNNLSYIGKDLFMYSSIHEYTIFEDVTNNFEIKMIRRITKNNNKIILKNLLKINNMEEKEVEFENIGSFYNIDDKIIICPRGNYHPFEYFDGSLKERIPSNFKEKGNWDLKCFQENKDLIQIIYLMNGKYSLYLFTSKEFFLDENNKYFDELYDVKLIKENNQSSESFLSIAKIDGNIELFMHNPQSNNFLSITKSKLYSKVYLDEKENKFYFISFNNSSDFISGYCYLYNINDLSSINININDKSPFNFNNNEEIKEIYFIPNNNYIYYTIYTQIEQKFYYGVMDIILNKILFEISEQLSFFKPYLKDSILAINSNSAYKIVIQEREVNINKNFSFSSTSNLDCYELCKSCSENSTNETDQKCIDCINNFILVRNNCQCENGYQKVDKECQKCPNECKTYQLNSCKCKNCNESYYMDDDSEFCIKCPSKISECRTARCCLNCTTDNFWEEGKCLKCQTNCSTFEDDGCRCNTCEDGYYLYIHQCLECDSNCRTCSGLSNKCLSCNDGYFLQNNTCSKCDINCKTCEWNATNCTTCKDKQFLEENRCFNCSTNCLQLHEDMCKCITCEEKYKIENFQCIACENKSPYCSHYKTNECTCDTCIEGFYLNNTNCEKCDTNCKTCNIISTNCIDCYEGFFEDKNKCHKCTECNETKGDSCRCKSCKDGTYLEFEQCKNCSEKCEKCDINPDYCYSCNEGYYYFQYKCYDCYDRCKSCISGPDETSGHNCDTCKDNYVFLNKNCLDNCPDNYYEENKLCKLCDPLCKTRGEDCNKCESCYDGYYFVENESKCKKCHDHCEKCSIGEIDNNENCESCDINSDYKYLVNATGFGNNCVSKCPNGTILKENICVLYVPYEEEKGKGNTSKVLVIIISIFGSLLVVAIILYIIIYFKKRKTQPAVFQNKFDDKLISEINKDLQLYQSFT